MSKTGTNIEFSNETENESVFGDIYNQHYEDTKSKDKNIIILLIFIIAIVCLPIILISASKLNSGYRQCELKVLSKHIISQLIGLKYVGYVTFTFGDNNICTTSIIMNNSKEVIDNFLDYKYPIGKYLKGFYNTNSNNVCVFNLPINKTCLAILVLFFSIMLLCIILLLYYGFCRTVNLDT